jgi:hypothetical protein
MVITALQMKDCCKWAIIFNRYKIPILLFTCNDFVDICRLNIKLSPCKKIN